MKMKITLLNTIIFLLLGEISIGQTISITCETTSLSETIGSGNSIIFGTESGNIFSTGGQNAFLGSLSGTKNTTGENNTFLGYYSGNQNKSGSDNTFLGRSSGYKNISGIQNTFVGYASGRNSNGDFNTYLGYRAGYKGNGDGNIFIGYNAGYSLTNVSNTLVIQNDYSANPLIYGDFSSKYVDFNGRIGINLISNNTPNNNLEIRNGKKGNSGLRFTNLTSSYNPPQSSTNTKFLSVNANGDVVLQHMANNIITNSLVSNVNTMTSSVNGLPASASIVNSISNSITSSNQLITKVNGVASAPVNLPVFTEVDGSITNELQNLSLLGNTLSISSGNSIVLPSTLVTAGPNVTVTGNGSSATPYVVSATNTDAQSLTLSGNNLTITNGNTVVLPIPTFTEVDGSITNELQTLSQAGNVVTLSNGGGSFTLPTDTDQQSLSLVGNSLSISNGNSVTLPTTSVIAGTNVTVTGTGTTATPFQINAVDTSLYANNGSINQATTTGVNRIVDMNNRNIWFNTTNSTSNGKIYLGSTSVYPTTTGNYKLFVEGGILTEKVKVALRSTANWADYVFADNYKLMPLKELEQFVVSNKHLPGIDSASELTKNGLDLAEMQSKQMEKIEELTLYVIEQNKTLESQSRILENQNKEIEELKSQMKALIEKTK